MPETLQDHYVYTKLMLNAVAMPYPMIPPFMLKIDISHPYTRKS